VDRLLFIFELLLSCVDCAVRRKLLSTVLYFFVIFKAGIFFYLKSSPELVESRKTGKEGDFSLRFQERDGSREEGLKYSLEAP